MGFKTKNKIVDAERVNICIMCIICIMIFIFSFQVSLELGIPDNVWQNTLETIAKSVDSLGYEFHPLFRAGWLAYINKTYGAPQPRPDQSVGKEPVVVEY
jgi:hypothetical protein